MPQIDSNACFVAPSSSPETKTRRARRRDDAAEKPRKCSEIQPFPQWARLSRRRVGDPDATAAAAFAAGASLARLDQILRSGADISSAGRDAADVSRAGKNSGADISSASRDSADGSSAGESSGEGGAEPVFIGALRQRLALRAAAACAAMARLREDEAGLRDTEHLTPSTAGAHTSSAGRLHRLWRLFATRPARLYAPLIRAAADCLDLPPDLDCEALAALAQDSSTAESPVNAVARISAQALHVLDDAPQIDAEILALWLADLALALRLRWEAPLPLLATAIMHPSLRTESGRRPRPSDADWSLSVARADARAAQEAYALAGELSRRSEMLLSVAPKLRAKGAARVVDLLLADDCASVARAAKAAGLSDRASRRLFDRLVELGAARELSGRANFRLYGL